MKSRFYTLIAGLCEGNVQLDARQVGQGAPIELDGVAMSLAYDPVRDPNGLLVYVDFGCVPDDEKRDIYFTLLEENFIFSALKPVSFSLSPVSGRIVYAQRMALQELDARELGRRMAALSRRARRWRLAHIVKDHVDSRHGHVLLQRAQPFR